MGLECQGCHMPVYSGEAAVGGPIRDVHRHHFIGVDVPLVDFPGRDETMALVADLLSKSVSIQVSAPASIPVDQPFKIEVTVINDQAGHNVPTGTSFERQMWLEVLVRDLSSGQYIFETGTLDENEDLRDRHSDAVQNGTVAVDTALKTFGSKAYKNGQETPFFWEADEVRHNTIAAFDAQTVEYDLPAPATSGTLDLTVRLRFRAFAPHLLRMLELGYLVSELPIFEMAGYEQQIVIK
jgi:hypothetical protein